MHIFTMTTRLLLGFYGIACLMVIHLVHSNMDKTVSSNIASTHTAFGKFFRPAIAQPQSTDAEGEVSREICRRRNHEIMVPATSNTNHTADKRDSILFRNASFEDKPGESIIPNEWILGTKGSTPDILPGAWGLSATPHGGKTCLGLVVRNDNTTEDVAQILSRSLDAGQCYELSVWLTRLAKYRGFNHACQLRIYGGEKGEKGELLASSKLISSTNWTEHKLQFTPKSNIKSITLVAYYGPGMLYKYNGNILIDDLGPIFKCDRA
jgi:hypothetical protein